MDMAEAEDRVSVEDKEVIEAGNTVEVEGELGVTVEEIKTGPMKNHLQYSRKDQDVAVFQLGRLITYLA